MRDTLRDGPQNDGPRQRFQVLVYPDVPRHWRYVDRAPHAAATAQAGRASNRTPAASTR
jgi:hypothetical protein